MKNHLKYAKERYSFWISWISLVLGLIAMIPFPTIVSVISVISCFILSFLIPLIGSYKNKSYTIKTMGKSKITLSFGDLFSKDCLLITTNRNFDVNPTGQYISESSLLGKFVKKYFRNNVNVLEEKIKRVLPINENNEIISTDYGKTIQIEHDGKIVYFMAFTDRRKENQPEDFYIKAVQAFLKEANNANHGRTISIPLLGDNNNLSNTGFSDSKSAFMCLLSMINDFEIINQRSELNLEIVVLPEKRSELIDIIAKYSK